MKLNNTPRQYMPLPQNQSDDEEHVANKEQKLENVCTKNLSNTSLVFSGSIQNPKAAENPKALPMTPLRLSAFIMSICMCIFFILAFILLLPCNAAIHDDYTMLSNNGKLTVGRKWAKVLLDKDITFARASFIGKPLLLIAFVETGTIFEETGILALREIDGKKLWELPLHTIPRYILCDILDVNGDQMPECLVTGDDGLLTAVEIEKGVSLWYLHTHGEVPLARKVSTPTVLPDCNEDGVYDVAVSYVVPSEKDVAYIGIVSGGNGRVIGSLVHFPYCSSPISNHLLWKWQNRTDFIFYCPEDETYGKLWLTSAHHLCSTALNKTGIIEAREIHSVYHSTDVKLQLFSTTKSKKLLMTVGCDTLALFGRSVAGNIKLKWERNLRGCMHPNVVIPGHFCQADDTQLALVVSNNMTSEVIGIHIRNGSESWSFSPKNGSITFVVNVHHFFGKTDGILLKTLTHIPINYDSTDYKILDISKSSAFINLTDIKDEEDRVNKTFCFYEEHYLLLKCKKMPIVRDIGVHDIFSVCEDSHCGSELCMNKERVVTSYVDANNDLIAVSTSEIPLDTGNYSQKQLQMKLLNLQDLVDLRKCPNNFF